MNGDPSRPVPLTDTGREEARLLGQELTGLRLDRGVCTRFGRTRETAEIALASRSLPLDVEPLLDDIAIGELEGETHDDYDAWKHAHTRDDPFPGGESLNDAARRYARGFRELLAHPSGCTLVVCHEIPIRYALNGAAGSSELDGPAHAIPNARPFLFDEGGLERAAARIDELAS